MKRAHTCSTRTEEAVKLLGARVRLGRRERRWTLQELADRVGVTAVTMRKVERGDLTVGLGIAFEAATLVGVPLFHEDSLVRSLETGRVEARLSVLPKAVRRPKTDDDF
jgi:transcriptional regulator with XRE-family HTH domain